MADTVPAPFTLRWGIMATGHVAQRFTKDLLTNPSTRDVRDVRHEITAIASSSSLQKAADFCTNVEVPGAVKLYASYSELVADAEIDIVYIATPVSHHFRNAMMAIEAGKAVLSDNSLNLQSKDSDRNLDPDHRLLKLDLGGGAMLDLGIYSLSWVMQILYHLQPEENKEMPRVVSVVNKHTTGVDEMASFILQFPQHKAMGIGMTSLRIASGVDYDFTAGPPIRIQGSAGEIQVFGPAFRPKKYCLIRKDANGRIETEEFETPKDKEKDNWGHGLYWEADECARCIRDGKLESQTLPLDESILNMEIMEKILTEGGVQYPAEIVTTATV